MKKKTVIALITLSLTLIGCGSGVSQDDYDLLSSQKDTLQESYNALLEEKNELEDNYEKLNDEYNELLEQYEGSQEVSVESTEEINAEPQTDLMFSDLPAQESLIETLAEGVTEIGVDDIGEMVLLSYDESSITELVTTYDADISMVCDDIKLIATCTYIEDVDNWTLSEIVNAANGHTYWCIDSISAMYDLYSFPDDELVSAKDDDITSDEILDNIRDSYESETEAARESFEDSLDALAEKYGIERN